MSTFSQHDLQEIFKSPYKEETWIGLLRDLFNATQIRKSWEALGAKWPAIDGYYIGKIETVDHFSIGLFYFKIKQGSVEKKRVGLRNLVKGYINPNQGVFDAALAVFVDDKAWRLSLICDIKEEKTEPKRFTFVFGHPELNYRTAASRFEFLQNNGISFENLMTAFSVEALSDDFFNKYRENYAAFVQHVTGMRYVKVDGKWKEVKVHEPDEMFARAFNSDAKCVRDYIKKMMGRITFLHFLQRKGWMAGDLNYMQNLFNGSSQQDNFLDAVLEPLFYGILNTKPNDRAAVFKERGWNPDLIAGWQEIPYLNGGLFERDATDEPDSVFPKALFQKLFNFFGEYNFTIDENDPNDAEIGVDPEMLGKIFENLLEDNKDKGAFYTPKEIVQYMCRESLVAYLHKATQYSLETIRAFVESPEEKADVLGIRQGPRMNQALANVKICDPAIGSGAFPMGMLNELLRCREALGEGTIDRAALKRDIISQNIYGVDIEKGAVDIARLRFWLSIVVDETEPSPLPNLDYKIMQGDSLRESYMGCDLSKLGKKAPKPTRAQKQDHFSFAHELTQGEFVFDESHAQDKMQDLIQAYYHISDHTEKQKVKDAISSTIREYIKFSGQATSSRILHSLEAVNIPNNDFFLWHTFYGDVLNKSDNPGFDIIIGNPPYIQLSENSGYLGKLYKPCSYESFAQTGDIYCLFYEQSWNMLRKGGHLCFITSNKWMRAAYGKALRNFFALKTNPKLLIDCGGYQVFKNATVDTNILLFAKEENQGHTLSATLPRTGTTKLSDFVQQHAVDCNFPSSESWIILSPLEQSIKQKIEAVGTPLKDWGVNIYRGVLTGCNEAFVITSAKRNEILSKCKTEDERNRTAELIRPILRGRDIKRYDYVWAGLWLIATFPSKTYDIDDYPAVKQYLLSIGKERLEQTGERHVIRGVNVSSRKKTNNEWYETQDSISYWEDFSKPKIVWAELARTGNAFTIDVNHLMVGNTGYILTVENNELDTLFYLLAFLNSKYMLYSLNQISTRLDETGWRWLRQFVEILRVPKTTRECELIRLTKSMLKQRDEKNQEQINVIIYDIFGFSEKEREYIDAQLLRY